MFRVENPGAEEDADFRTLLNPDSLKTLTNCYVEPFAASLKIGDYLQFQRIGYFTIDSDTQNGGLVFNRTVGLRDSWGKINKK